MDISYFREFVILAETRNYWAASERLFIGQSSLSKHIKTMEKQLGAPLFARTSRKVELTEVGERLLPYARSIARMQYEYEAAVQGMLHPDGGQLTVASIPALAPYRIVDILVRFQQDFPGVQVQTNEVDTLAVRELLVEGKCDVAVYRESAVYLEHDPEKEKQLVKLPFCTDRLVAVLPVGHPLAGRESLELAQLQGEKFALIQRDTMPYSLCMAVCQEAGFTPEVVFTSHSRDAVFDMVTKGGCVALLFERHVAPSAAPENAGAGLFAAVPVSPPIETTLVLAYLRNRPLSRPAKNFLDYCMMQREEH